MLTTKSCPTCDLPFEHHCHHDGDDVTSVEMPVAEAVKLMLEYWYHLSSKTDRHLEEIRNLRMQLDPVHRRDLDAEIGQYLLER